MKKRYEYRGPGGLATVSPATYHGEQSAIRDWQVFFRPEDFMRGHEILIVKSLAQAQKEAQKRVRGEV